MPTPTAAERLHAQQQKNRKAAGLPDPSEYKKKLDAMKSEEVEQLDEISDKLKASYVSGAKKQIKQSLPFTKKTDEYRDIAKNFIAKRQKGIARANEEVEQLDEMPESNMKVRDVHSHLKKAGWALARSKGGHDVFKHPKAKHSIPVPRHSLKAPLVRGILKASKVEEQLEKKGRFVSGPIKQPFKSNTIVTAVKEGVTVGKVGGRGNIHMYDRNPGPKDGSELENVPFHAKTEKQKKLQNALNDLGKKMKETHPKLREAKDAQEYDYEGDMAKSDLRSILHHAKELHDMIEDNTNLAEWCQSKITLAEDYLSTVANYMRSEMNEETVQEDKNDYQRKIDKNNKNFAAATKRQKNPLSNKKVLQGAEFAAQRRKERLASNGRMDEDVEQLDEKKNLPGLWANIHAKRKRGEPPAKPGDKDYPKTLNIESAVEPTEGEMKGKQQGVSRKAQIVRDAAKGKKSDNPDKFQKDPELSSEIHKT